MISRRDVGKFCMAVAAGATLPTRSDAGPPDKPDPLCGMILGPGPYGYCDDLRVGVATPLWSAERRQWLMWYYGKNAAFDPASPPTLASGYVALATSEDGLFWRRHPGGGAAGSVLAPSQDPAAFDSLHLGVTDVTYANGSYWMWYFGGDRTPSVDSRGNHVLGFRTLPGLARSPDGLAWTKIRGKGPGGALFDSDGDVFASWAAVVHDGSRFIMHYTAGSEGFEILRSHVAFSQNGVDWQKQGEIKWSDAPVEWDSKGIIARQLLRNPFPGPRFLMIYAGIDSNPARFKRRSIAAAVSDDAVTWRHLYPEPIFTVDGSGGWDAGEVTAPHMVVAERELRLFYLGGAAPNNSTGFRRGVGLAVSDGNNLRGFRRYAAARLAV